MVRYVSENPPDAPPQFPPVPGFPPATEIVALPAMLGGICENSLMRPPPPPPPPPAAVPLHPPPPPLAWIFAHASGCARKIQATRILAGKGPKEPVPENGFPDSYPNGSIYPASQAVGIPKAGSAQEASCGLVEPICEGSGPGPPGAYEFLWTHSIPSASHKIVPEAHQDAFSGQNPHLTRNRENPG